MVSCAETIGLGGLFLQALNPPPSGTVIELLFDLSSGEVRARASVRDSVPGKGMGVQFILVASAEVTDLKSKTRLSARISELAIGGCYVDALDPFPEGTIAKIKITRDRGVFETNAKVVYSYQAAWNGACVYRDSARTKINPGGLAGRDHHSTQASLTRIR